MPAVESRRNHPTGHDRPSGAGPARPQLGIAAVQLGQWLLVTSVSPRLPAAVLWDFDGMILDTEPAWMASEIAYVASHSAVWTLDDARGYIGASWRTLGNALGQRIAEETGTTGLDPWDIYQSVSAGVVDQVRAGQAPLRPGALELLDALGAAAVPCALVSSSPESLLRAGVAALGIPAPFEALIAGPMVEHGKPAPDCYLLAAATLQVPIGQCVVLEDSPTGCEAGQRSGALVIGIPSVAPLPSVAGQLRRDSLVGLTVADLAAMVRAHGAHSAHKEDSQ